MPISAVTTVLIKDYRILYSFLIIIILDLHRALPGNGNNKGGIIWCTIVCQNIPGV